jgi:hypothetical protein
MAEAGGTGHIIDALRPVPTDPESQIVGSVVEKDPVALRTRSATVQIWDSGKCQDTALEADTGRACGGGAMVGALAGKINLLWR